MNTMQSGTILIKYIIFLVIFIIFLCALLTFMLITLIHNINETNEDGTLFNSINLVNETAFVDKKILTIIKRNQWLAKTPSTLSNAKHLSLPVGKVIIAHSRQDGCETKELCTIRVRLLQIFHMETRNWSDIGHNFLVGGDGNVYEGRGWDLVGSHTKGYNNASLSIAFIGTFKTITPKQQQLNAAKELILRGLELGKIANNYKLYGQSTLIKTDSPGNKLFDIIKTWHNFQEYP